MHYVGRVKAHDPGGDTHAEVAELAIADGELRRPTDCRRGWPDGCDVNGHGNAAFGAYCWIVTVGGVFVASIVMNRGMSRAGGGTGLSVVRRRLEPSAE